MFFFFFKQKTAYEIGTGDWSSDVCSSDLMENCEMVVCGPSDIDFNHIGAQFEGTLDARKRVLDIVVRHRMDPLGCAGVICQTFAKEGLVDASVRENLDLTICSAG